MGFFKRSDPPPPPNNDKPTTDDGFVDRKAKKYHCACGHETNTSPAMDAHVASKHSD